MKKPPYSPPYQITPEIVRLIARIGEALGRLPVEHPSEIAPMLRRGNRLRTIQASLAIENNTLTLDQVTAIVDGRRVLGHPREIQEVKNAFRVYEMLEDLDPHSETDLLKAHSVLMASLVDEAGCYRSGGVGVMQGTTVVHMAPPASRVPVLMGDLFDWLKTTDAHPLIASSVFHYEFEFIHPFADGNGRMGRFWQTLILSRWRPILAWLPVETVIRNRQEGYYKVLGASDEAGDASPFIEFMLSALLESLMETDQVSDQVSDQVKQLLRIFDRDPLSASELMQRLHLSHRPTFRKNYLQPAMEASLLEMTIPDKSNSRLQKYRVTRRGAELIKKIKPSWRKTF